MFPYEGELKVLQCTTQPPYRWEYIFKILLLLLVDYCLGTLNPHHDGGDRLVQEMLQQIMKLHHKSTSLHIGADEVQPNPPCVATV